MAATTEYASVLRSVLGFKNKRRNVTLTPKYIAVEDISSAPESGIIVVESNRKKQKCLVIPLEEVAAVRCCEPPNPNIMSNGSAIGESAYQKIDIDSLDKVVFELHVMKRGSRHRWRHKVLTFTCKEISICCRWVEEINSIIHGPGSIRPRRLLVFVNPSCGKRKASKLWTDLLPLFQLAGISVDIIETTRKNHARDEMYTYDLSKVDGVVCVGGDGTFSEVLNGLLDRTNKEAGVPQAFRHQPVRPNLRIGVIPAGSTDCIVYSTTGTNDPLTSAMQIIMGGSIGVDVSALYKEDDFLKYSITMTSYGFYGDLLEDSERRRWMGSLRYVFSGVKKLMGIRPYAGQVSFLPHRHRCPVGDVPPLDNDVCYAGYSDELVV